MDVQEFQKKLSEISGLAIKNGKCLKAEQVLGFFSGMDLDKGQMLKVLQYLKALGITIEGVAVPEENTEKEPERQKRVPLTPEEEAYFRNYKAGLETCPMDESSLKNAFERMAQGEANAKREIVQYYLPEAAAMAVEFNCNEMILADLIQEANVSLLTALELPEPAVKDDAWLRKEIRRGIIQVIEEQTQRKFADDCLVAKVEKLDSAMKDLTEDEEDGKMDFSIGELAVILDMNVEEIKDVLRLTGEES